jgi:histidinol-phosphatase (PHP family)
MGGKFTMSDDSHGIAQIATNYAPALSYLESLGVQEVWTLKRTTDPGPQSKVKAALDDVAVPLSEFRKHFS